MTIYLPFLFFTSIAIFQYRRNGSKVDIAVFISMIYAISGFFSIVLNHTGWALRDISLHKPSIASSLIYCGLLLLCLFPFLKYSNINISSIQPIKNEGIIVKLAWVCLIWFVLTFIVDLKTIMQVLTGDFAELRYAINNGERLANEAANLPFVIRKPWALLNYIFKCPWVVIFLGFFSKYVQKLPTRYFVFFIMASTTVILEGIITIDRSKTTYWIIAIGVNYLFFHNYMDSKQRKEILRFLGVLVCLAMLYISFATDSRYGDSSINGGALGSIIDYLGESYPNFCYFFDTFESPWTSNAIVFPTIYYFLYPDEIYGGVPLQEQVTSLTGIFTGVFYTFIGHIMTIGGIRLAVGFCVVYFTIVNTSLNRISKKNQSVSTIYLYQAFASIMLYGVFVHYYASPILDLSVISTYLLICIFFKK